MDLQNFTRDEYIAHSWYIHGDYAIRPGEFVMLGNTRSPLNSKGDLETVNAKLIFRSLPLKDGLRDK